MMIKAGEWTINPAYVAVMHWDRRHYANCAGVSALIVRMHDGYEMRISHEPHLMGGVDAYTLEREIIDACKSIET